MDPELDLELDLKNLDDLIAAFDARRTIEGGSPLHAVLHAASQEALRITGELNSGYHPPERVRELLAELTGRPIDESVTLFPPLRADFGRSLRIGARVFINSGCAFQDQGGVTIGDDCLIGHDVVFATLNHDLDPARRGDLHPAPIVVGSNVWIGAKAVLLAGVTVGDDAVIAAAAVVTKDVPAGAVVVGAPARVVRNVRDTGADATA
ncbi:DapH/DapD/GlmU-related protein [Rathayibacter festucae]|uniref:Acetyltransferase n=1 Tax=Rathayibacter festucae DSM 15932 TaxID=1328866 RepID=A0A3T0SZB0_9MICO|nr:DapH/DapD/GlmU-related protein [Rathayibacter festucae]AZZ51664.1 acetyltransferase [Rathayibacter festucae DSM 15932]